jgi:hypothetical protein
MSNDECLFFQSITEMDATALKDFLRDGNNIEDIQDIIQDFNAGIMEDVIHRHDIPPDIREHIGRYQIITVELLYSLHLALSSQGDRYMHKIERKVDA